MIEQAYSLERAQKQSSVYSQPITASVAKPPQDRDAFEQHTAVPTSEDALTKDESAVAAVQKKKNAFSVEALITSNAVVLLGMLSVMNAGKLGTSLRFLARSLLTGRARISRLRFCLSTTSVPWSEPQLAYNLLLLTLKSRDFQPVLCWTLGHRTVTLTLKLQKNLA